MPRKNTKVVYRYRKAKSRSRKRGNPVMTEMLGMGGYVVAEGVLDSFLAKTPIGIPSNLIELGLGYYLKGKKGVVGAVGKTMFTINGYQLVKDLIGSKLNLNGLFGTQQTQQTNQTQQNW